MANSHNTAPVDKPHPESSSTHGVESLSFVESHPENAPRSFWTATPATSSPQDFGIECWTGNALAHEFVEYLSQAMCDPGYDGLERHLLADIVRSMPRGKDSTGVELGFFYEFIKILEPSIQARQDPYARQ